MTVRHRSMLIIGLSVALLGMPAAGLANGAGAQAPTSLSQDLDTLLANPALTGANVGLVVKDAATGSTLYDHHGADLLLPASNLKLFTSATAMNVLGPDYTFDTTVSSDGVRAGSTLAGNLYLTGTGDPTLLAADYDALAAKVAAAGIKRVAGQFVADDTWFDSQRLATGWEVDDEPYYYDAQVSALTISPDTDYDPGSVDVTVSPAAPGHPPTITVTPPNNYLTIVNTATTGAAGSATTDEVDRDEGDNVIRVTGSIAADAAPDVETMSVWDPTRFVASLFRADLAAHGVTVLGPTGYRATPAKTTSIASRTSMPLSRLLTPFLKLSNNLHAETLVKAAGRKVSNQGSWPAGLAALEGNLGSFGVNAQQLAMADGSGLSRHDFVSADQISTLLVGAQQEPWFSTWYDALPVAGVSDRMVGGTLRDRMGGTPAANNLHAKTGSMTGVSALSGYVTAANGEKLVFSMVENNFLPDSVTSIEDAVGVRLAEYDGATDRSRVVQPRIAVAPGRDPKAALECSWTRHC
jgi:D-alanyl-D-alanine carboxypeptidase/D-alanyl-D-alanine-endopeptidase (penicillin-binding protein 4)